MNIRDLGYFLAIVEYKSLQRASIAMGLSQPALTKCVHRLEEALGVRLFERGPGGTLPTQAALSFLEYAKRMNADYGGAMQMMGDLAASEAAVIRLGTTPIWEFLVHEAIGEFLPQRPASRFRVSILFSDKLLSALANGYIDLALVTAPKSDPAFEVVNLSDDVMVPVARSAHPLHHLGRAPTLTELAAASWALPRTGVLSRDQLEQVFSTQNLPAPIVQVEVDGGAPLGTFTLLNRSDLIGLCPSCLSNTAAAAGLLPLVVDGLKLRTGPSLVTRKDSVLTPVVEMFIRRVAELAKPAQD